MLISKCIDEFLAYISTYGSSDTVAYYKICLKLFSEFLDSRKFVCIYVGRLTKNDFIEFVGYLRKKDIKNTSVRTYARGVKVFLRYCYDNGYVEEDITRNIKYPRSDARMIVPLSMAEVQQIHTYLCRYNSSLRNLLIIYLMLDCGLRRGEVCRLNVDDIDFSTGFIRIVDSKYNKNRLVPMSYRVRVLITDYLERVNFYSAPTSPLLVDSSCEHRITKSTINCMVYRLKKVVSRVYPHLFRHTFGTSFCMGNGGIEVLKILMGHSDIVTTQGYVHIANQCKLIDYDIYKLDDVFFKYCNYNYKE